MWRPAWDEVGSRHPPQGGRTAPRAAPEGYGWHPCQLGVVDTVDPMFGIEAIDDGQYPRYYQIGIVDPAIPSG